MAGLDVPEQVECNGLFQTRGRARPDVARGLHTRSSLRKGQTVCGGGYSDSQNLLRIKIDNNKVV